jgi:hypothetical protein
VAENTYFGAVGLDQGWARRGDFETRIPAAYSNGQFVIQAADVAITGRLTVNSYSLITNYTEPGWTYARFSHSSNTTVTNYALMQAQDGTTLVNAASGKEVYLRSGNVTYAWLDINNGKFRIANGIQLQIDPSANLDGFGQLNGSWGGSGGALRARGGGNVISFAWTGTFQMWVDTTNVKNFVIDHPQDENKYLIHACLEGPEAAVYYRGQGRLVGGWARVDLPAYFETLCAEEGRSVQLTCIADDPADEWCPVLHATYPKDGSFYVGLGSGTAVQDQRFWWEVKAVRRDVDPLLVEPDRQDVVVMGDGPYTYYREKR